MKQTTDHQALAIEPAEQKYPPIAGGHTAEAGAPQIDGHDEGIELDREQDAGEGLILEWR